ncbi:MAG: hypothetical protein IKZ02_01470, partial [Alphaproteobacteria bacterium]|nr:hypothetical protein [Alphaproteobacteria bacterium]
AYGIYNEGTMKATTITGLGDFIGIMSLKGIMEATESITGVTKDGHYYHGLSLNTTNSSISAPNLYYCPIYDITSIADVNGTLKCVSMNGCTCD